MLPVTPQVHKHKQYKRPAKEGPITQQYAGVYKLLTMAKWGFSPCQNTNAESDAKISDAKVYM